MDTVQDTPVRKRIIKLHKYDSCPAPVRKKTINLLEHPDLVVGAGELVTLQGEIHRARKTLTEQETRYATMKRHPDLVAGSEELVTLQGEIHRARKTLTEQETCYATMKQKFDLALKKASEEQHHGPKTNTTA